MPETREPYSVCWAVRSYGYEVAVLDRDGQIIDSHSADPGRDWNETISFARLTARETAEEHGIPLRRGRVFQDQELMLTVKDVRAIR
jgi:hypothetical protein